MGAEATSGKGGAVAYAGVRYPTCSQAQDLTAVGRQVEFVLAQSVEVDLRV